MGNSQSEDDSKDRAGFLFHDVCEWELKPGDHIYAYRVGTIYSHHGIFTGERGQRVIHFSGAPGRSKSKSSAHIQAATVDEFCDGATLRLVAYDVKFIAKIFKRSGTAHCYKSYPADEVITTAKHFLHNPEAWDDYHLLFNNCESFAVYCKTGLRGSDQVNVPVVGGLMTDIGEGIGSGIWNALDT